MRRILHDLLLKLLETRQFAFDSENQDYWPWESGSSVDDDPASHESAPADGS